VDCRNVLKVGLPSLNKILLTDQQLGETKEDWSEANDCQKYVCIEWT
jgi:hypothetical protein